MIRCTIRIDTIIIEWLKTDGNNNSYSILYNVKENTRERGRKGGREGEGEGEIQLFTH